MATITANLPLVLQLVTRIARLVSHSHRSAHQSRTAGHVGTAKTFLVAPTAQRGNGKHRVGTAR